MNHKAVINLLIGMCFLTGNASAAPLIYTPVNPNFGGNPNNSTFLMSEATANNHFVNNSANATALTPTQQIAQQITSTVLADVASKISDQIYGENAVNSGSYQLGSSTISFVHVGTNIQLTVNDGQGGVTTVTIPAPTM